jgi:acetoin utilization deacetylase AcuC-like enzyme
VGAPVFLHHPSSLRHDLGPHPERAERIVAIERELNARDWLGWERRASPEAEPEALLAVHPLEHIRFIRELSEGGGGPIDMDTATSAGSYEAALHAAGGACAAVDAVLGEDAARCAFSAHRPPGHHAEPARAMGFCLFNNVAVAARWALDRHGLSRVLIVDWDVHHGNGTNDIFHATDEVLFVSLHEYPLYPGTGPASDVGSGAGEGYTVNLPVPGGTGDAVWVSLVADVVRPVARAFAPELVLVSAGYDAHVDDPLAGCLVGDDGFAAMAAWVRAIAADAGAPLAVTLEGGYEVSALARSVARTMEVLGAADAPPPPEVERHPLADAALERLASGRWSAAVTG